MQGLYVRVNIGNSSGGERRYLVCEVLGIRDKASECQVGAPRPPCVPGAVGGGVPRVRAPSAAGGSAPDGPEVTRGVPGGA